MPPLAQRNLFHDKVRLTVTLTGIVFSVVLIVVQLGLFLGFTTATSNLIDHSGADLWIASRNVPYVEQGVAFSERKLNQVRAVPQVAWVGTMNWSAVAFRSNRGFALIVADKPVTRKLEQVFAADW
jgi:putative ABC transport system permease protein